MFYKFDFEAQIKNILSKKTIDFNRELKFDLKKRSGYISDVHDSDYYTEFLKSKEGNSVINGNGFTMSISTDGVNPSDKSKISV